MTEPATVNSRPRDPWRVCLRVLLVLVVITSIAITVRDFVVARLVTGMSVPPDNALIVTLHHGGPYGDARVRLSGADATSWHTEDPRLARALADAFKRQGPGKSNVVLRASGGVKQAELERIKQLLLRASGGRLDSLTLMVCETPAGSGLPSDPESQSVQSGASEGEP